MSSVRRGPRWRLRGGLRRRTCSPDWMANATIREGVYLQRFTTFIRVAAGLEDPDCRETASVNDRRPRRKRC